VKERRLFAAGLVAALGPLGFVTTMLQAQTQEPEMMHGARIAAQGTAAGAPPCTQCHAVNGVSDASGGFPRLAGQSADYLAEQLRDFASEVRTSALMTPIAKALSPDEIADVSAYYANLDAPFLPLKPGAAVLIKRGEQLAKVGSAEQQIQNCDNCHGPGGAGEPPAIPYLAGQYAPYIASTLQMWQQGDRKNSPDAMAVVAKKLSDQDIAAVAAYYQQVQATLEATESPRKAMDSKTKTPESQAKE
jgi:cytochrome c553